MWSRDFLAGVNKPVNKVKKKNNGYGAVWWPNPYQVASWIFIRFQSISCIYIPLKISMTVPMDHAKMEEVAQMLWMILIVAVFLDTRGRIAVLVSHVLHVIESFYLQQLIIITD